MLFLDLDGFKDINDNHGHEAGDRVLAAVAQRCRPACARGHGRATGGDEFTVLLEDITDMRFAIAVAQRIDASLQDPFRLDGSEATVTASSASRSAPAARPPPRT